MALDEAGMQELVDQIYSLFTQQNEVNTFGGNPDGWADEHLPPGTEASDVSACMPEVADRIGGQYQGNLANYNAQAAPATAHPVTEIGYTYNTIYQQNAF